MQLQLKFRKVSVPGSTARNTDENLGRIKQRDGVACWIFTRKGEKKTWRPLPEPCSRLAVRSYTEAWSAISRTSDASVCGGAKSWSSLPTRRHAAQKGLVSCFKQCARSSLLFIHADVAKTHPHGVALETNQLNRFHP